VDAPDAHRELLHSWMSQLIAERSSADTAATLMSEGLARALLGLCWRMRDVSEMPAALLTTLPRWFMIAMRHIRESPGTSVQELAQLAGFSVAQFRRRFSELTGLSPRAYLQQHRLQAAQLLLETTELPIGQVAEQLGFESAPYSNHQFKRSVGRSPSDFRRESKLAKV